jgi:non-ribosomal peptide synthase protein (TIGR01720 family)
VRAALHGASDQGAALPATPLAEVCFNYLGQSDNALPGPLLQRIAPESPGAQSAADLPRRYLLDCNVSVLDGELVFHWGFDARRLDPAWVDALASEVADTLATLTAQARDDLDELLGGLDLSGMDTP